jgi:hypothetical protein
VVVNRQIHFGSKLLNRFKPFPEFQVRMDIGVIEKAVYLDPFFPQDLKGIGSARTAADVE